MAIFPFGVLPGALGEPPRPLMPVTVEGSRLPFAALIDSGALHNRFSREIADEVGIDLSAIEPQLLAVGGFRTSAYTVPARLAIGDVEWEAPVGFCDPWPIAFQLLGQEGFFRWFRVEIRAAVQTVELKPEAR